ncbi:MAG: hypothetical protein DDT37_01119 [Firmicutes bacterium]|nr:hypothetical protein [candidate division NPL-UPA2 bacterium]
MAVHGNLIPGHSRRVHILPDGGNHGISLQVEKGPRDGNRAAPAGGIGFPKFHPLAGHNQHAAVSFNFNRRGQQVELHPFLFALFNFYALRRHLLPLTPVNNHHLRCAEPARCSGRIHGCIAAAYHGNPSPKTDRSVLHHGPQELSPADHPRQVFARHPHALAVLSPDSQINRVITALKQIANRKVLAKLQVYPGSYAEVQHLADFSVQNTLGQTVLRDAVAQHPAQLR